MNTETEHTFIYHQDPGHGWLQVPLTLLRRLKVTGEISPYSYMDGRHGYLEEDCDYGVFIRAAQAAGLNYRIIDRHDDNCSPIRDMDPFRVATPKQRLNP